MPLSLKFLAFIKSLPAKTQENATNTAFWTLWWLNLSVTQHAQGESAQGDERKGGQSKSHLLKRAWRRVEGVEEDECGFWTQIICEAGHSLWGERSSPDASNPSYSWLKYTYVCRGGMSGFLCVSVCLLMGPEVVSEKDASNFRRHTLTQKFVRSRWARGHRGAAMPVDRQEDMWTPVSHIRSEI